jgi:hypothetical protein
MYKSLDEQLRDPASILASVVSRGDAANPRQRWKPGRKIASPSDLVAWAASNGRILTPTRPFTRADGRSRAQSDSEVFATDRSGGNEHTVYYDPTIGRIYKITKPGVYGAQGDDAGAYLQRWALANSVANDDVKFEGLIQLLNEEDMSAVISQPFVTGRDATIPESADYLKSKGFRQGGGWRWIHPVTGVAVWDVPTIGNAITRPDGSVQPIDWQFEPATSDELLRMRAMSMTGGEPQLPASVKPVRRMLTK